MKTYRTISLPFNEYTTINAKPFAMIKDVCLTNSGYQKTIHVTLEEDAQYTEDTKIFSISLRAPGSLSPGEFFGSVKTSDVMTTTSTSGGGNVNINTQLSEIVYMVFYTEVKPQEELRDERIDDVLS